MISRTTLKKEERQMIKNSQMIRKQSKPDFTHLKTVAILSLSHYRPKIGHICKTCGRIFEKYIDIDTHIDKSHKKEIIKKQNAL